MHIYHSYPMLSAYSNILELSEHEHEFITPFCFTPQKHPIYEFLSYWSVVNSINIGMPKSIFSLFKYPYEQYYLFS
jgi:hypothetical protein